MKALGEALGALEDKLRYRWRLGGHRLPRSMTQFLLEVLDTLKPVGAGGDVEKELASIARALQGCERCGLHRFRRTIVVGEGSPSAALAFVGEGPGEAEDQQGRPFVGPAGQLLTRIIMAMGFQRSQVFIANVVKCRPPANRAPKPAEVSACRPFLIQQLRAISPQVICTLGTVASQALLRTEEKITSLRGRMQEWEGHRVMPTYHPSYLLRNPERKREVWEDMKRVMAHLR